MNAMNCETQKYNDRKRHFRLQKRREEVEHGLPVMRRERRQSRTAVLTRARETSHKHISASKLN